MFWGTAVSGKNCTKLRLVKIKPLLTAQHKANSVAFIKAGRSTYWPKMIFEDSKHWIKQYSEGFSRYRRWPYADEQPVACVSNVHLKRGTHVEHIKGKAADR